MKNLFSSYSSYAKIMIPLLVGFFLVFTLITAFIIVPEVNESFEDQYQEDLSIELALGAEMFQRFVENKKSIIQDFANNPNVVNAAMLSSKESLGFVDFIENLVIDSHRGRVVLYDLAGDVVYKSAQTIRRNHNFDKKIFENLLNGKLDSYISLVGQDDESFDFIVTVPSKYGDHVEGLLSVEMNASFEEVFVSNLLDKNVAFKLVQDQTTIKTSSNHIVIPNETSKRFDNYNMDFVYITDLEPILQVTRDLRDKILKILFIGFIVSFTLVFTFSYKFFSEKDDKWIKPTDKKIYMIPAIVAVIGIIISVTAVLIFQNLEDQKIEKNITFEAKAKIEQFRQNIESNIKVIDQLKGFHDSSNFVSRQEFKVFSANILRTHKYIHALGWMPKVTKSQLPEYELQARDDGYKEFFIFERGFLGDFIPVKEREVYFPAYYLEPSEVNEGGLGFDLASVKKRLTAINLAINSGEIVATSRIKLLQEQEKQAVILAFNPVYEGDNSAAGIESLDGLYLMALRVGDLAQDSLPDNEQKFRIKVTDITNDKAPETLFEINDGEVSNESNLSYNGVLTFSGRKWNAEMIPLKSYLDTQTSLVSSLLLLLGLGFTAMITYILAQQMRRRAIVEALVDEKTEEIEDSKVFLELMMDSNPDLIFVKDEEFKIIEANERFLSLYPEEKRDKVIGYTTLEEYEPEEANSFLKMDKIAFKEGISESYEAIHFPGGEVRTLYTQKIRFENKKGKKFILGLSRDVTEREELIKKLKSSNEELDDFAYIASHDLKEPIRGINNYSSFLEKDYGDVLDEKGRHNIERIKKLTGHMEKLISDLFYYSRIGRSELGIKNNDLNEIVEEEAEALVIARNGGVEINIVNKLPTMMCDRVKVCELVRNLMSNGLKYNDNEKKVIEIGSKTTKGRRGQDIIFIRDNGIGIEERFHEDIFGIFRRLHKRDAYGGGSGSGLTFVKKIIEKHNGKIWLESKKGEGTTFFFQLGEIN